MARLKIVRVAGALLVSAVVLTGCSSAPAQKETPVAQAKSATHKGVTQKDRTPRWMKYRTSSSRIARPTDGTGRPISADMVQSTDSNGLYQLPSVTMRPCTSNRSGC
jgi:PBP1b-binding outer membrane lipoprotein LpoB